MRTRTCLFVLLAPLLAPIAPAQIPVLKRSDVVFMYQAGAPVYQNYGATVLAWGGSRKPGSAEEAQGLKCFGSVGMVTEFSRYYERFPDTYEQGLCRDLEGKPFKVPWLTDHKHKNVPYWWCCTRQPLFRQYLSERVTETVKSGVDGVHIDDHLGTAGALWSGGCFCERCVTEFRDYLKTVSNEQRQGVDDPSSFSYRDVLQAWVLKNPGQKVQQHPLWATWRVYQLRGAAQFMSELRALAARTAGRPVPVSANACILWGPHLNDYLALDFFSAEVEHHASGKHFSLAPLLGYRLAEAVGRPLAATASGGDWAFIKETQLHGLAQGWAALGYAAGHCLMAPNRQWCYTPEKGTHWYEGPADKFAPIYRFVRDNPGLFDGFENHADVTVAFSNRTFDRDPGKIASVCARLAESNVSYWVALGGDEIVDHPLKPSDLRRSARLLVIDQADFAAADRALLSAVEKERSFESVRDLLENLKPAAQVESGLPLRVFPRTKPGAACVHLLNWDYVPEKDSVREVVNAKLHLDLQALGTPGAKEARLFTPGAPPRTTPVKDGTVLLPELGLWTVVEIKRPE